MRTTLLAVAAALLLLTVLAPAVPAEETLVTYDLNLAGYQPGMSLDDAALVRPFQFTETLPAGNPPGTYFTVATIDYLSIDGIDISLRLYFRDDRLDKLIGRFPATAMSRLHRLLLQRLGPGTDLSRLVQRNDGSILELPVWRWDFPNARITLVGSAGGNDRGTLALSARHRKN
ncbi:hypothetical protein EDC39_10373 [Geothermobacter ehrlichii]|uniref:Uncharacterized protein n=1 Tax=Geothermobacter ehrlichii TaxID=213224 RepID=A0A5D3WKP1_9BACT|nr:hypothetical protein [Geothermobacter ehrlichii]TYO99230.1 hypothetical protein EDC39_10373 [Geothermobacter ehrlichii]